MIPTPKSNLRYHLIFIGVCKGACPFSDGVYNMTSDFKHIHNVIHNHRKDRRVLRFIAPGLYEVSTPYPSQYTVVAVAETHPLFNFVLSDTADYGTTTIIRIMSYIRKAVLLELYDVLGL